MNHPAYSFINTAAGLVSLAAEIAPSQRVALDTEADSLHHYFEKVCLIQLTVGGNNYIVDPLAGLDLSPLFHSLAGKEIIFHGADYDLRLLRTSCGFTPLGPIFDTMLAARLLGYERLGLAALAEEFFGVTLNKGGQKFDWSRRPLPADKLAYAANDTRYLEELADLLLKKLRGRGREEWLGETCEALLLKTGEVRPEEAADEIWRIKGLKDFRRDQLALVRALWFWRDAEARQSDVPSFKVLGNEPMIALALWLHSHPGKHLSQGPRLPRNCVGKRLLALERAIAEARALPPEKWPAHPERKRFIPASPRENERFNALREAVAGLAAKLQLPPSVIAPQATLWALARSDARTEDEIRESGRLTRWQARLLVPLI
jgi:ribonuclease D